MKCSKCNEEFEEKDLHCSHDIPKYIGGTDLEGRHWLCKECHDKYDDKILLSCLNFIGEHPKITCWEERIVWMKELKRNPNPYYKKLAKQIKKEFFKDEKREDENIC